MEVNIFKYINSIAKHSDNLSFKLIANFILKNYMKLEKCTIFDVAKETNTSASTVTRFCKKIGLSGYKKLIVEVQLYLRYINNPNTKTKVVDINADYYKIISKSLDTTYNINSQAIKDASSLINKSSNIYLFCKGGNIFFAHLFTDWLTRMHIKTFFSSDVDQQKTYTHLMSSDDCAVIISYSLANDFFHSIIESLHKNKIRIIVITKNDLTTLLNQDDIIIKIPENESPIKGRQSAEICSLFILKMIFNELLNEQRIKKILATDRNF